MGGGAKIFRPQDFEGMSPEEMAEKVSGGSRSRSRKSPNAAKPKMTVDADAENVELWDNKSVGAAFFTKTKDAS